MHGIFLDSKASYPSSYVCIYVCMVSWQKQSIALPRSSGSRHVRHRSHQPLSVTRPQNRTFIVLPITIKICCKPYERPRCKTAEERSSSLTMSSTPRSLGLTVVAGVGIVAVALIVSHSTSSFPVLWCTFPGLQ